MKRQNLLIVYKITSLVICVVLALGPTAPSVFSQDLATDSAHVQQASSSTQESIVPTVEVVPQSASAAAYPSATPSPTGVPEPTFSPSRKQPSAQLRQPVRLRKLSKKYYRANEGVQVILENTVDPDVHVTLKNAQGHKVKARAVLVHDTNPTVLTILPPNHFTPGKYTLEVQDDTGAVSEDAFVWGVLAINTTQSVYEPNDPVDIAIAVLDELGEMVCDASVELTITDPDGHVTVKTTADGSITVSPTCQTKALILEPDYAATYQAGTVGIYTISLSAETTNGTWTIRDSFQVQESVPFTVVRESATRIYPPEIYPMRFTITPNTDFDGTVTEIVPESFDISPIDGVMSYDDISLHTDTEQSDVLGEETFRLSLPYEGNYVVSQEFGGLSDDPLMARKYKDGGVIGHDGIDFDMPIGTPVLAVDDGTVVRARENYDYGTTIVLEHPWGKSYYGHLSRLDVNEGDSVHTGDVIGLSGNTGISTGPHLHFGMKLNNNDEQNGYFGKIDPAPYLGLVPESGEQVLGVSTDTNVPSGAKEIHWNVHLTKGQTVTLGYGYRVPPVSPQFYRLGPLAFTDSTGETVFRGVRQWQLAVDWLTQIHHANVFTDVTDTTDYNDTSWHDVANTTISDTELGSAGFSDTENVIIIADVNFDGSNTSTNFGMRVADTAGNAVADTTVIRRIRTADDRNEIMRIMVKTTKTSSEGFVLQKQSASATQYPIVFKGSITVIGLANLTVNDDYVWGEDNSSTDTLTTSSAPFASVTTPSGDSNWQGDVLIFDTWRADNNGTGNTSLLHDLQRDSDTPVNVTREEGQASGGLYGGGSVYVYNNADTNAHTYTVNMYTSSGSSFSHSYSAVLALRASLFEDFAYDNTDTEMTPGDTSYNELAGITPFSPSQSGDFFVTGFAVGEGNGASNHDDVRTRLQLDDTTIPTGYTDTGTNAEGTMIEDPNDLYPMNWASVESFDTASKDIDMDGASDVTAIGWSYRTLVAFSFGLASAPDAPYTSQIHYRWRDDTTDLNSSGGWLAAEDSSSIGSMTKNTTYRIRMDIANIGLQDEDVGRTYELQWGDRYGLSACSAVSTWTGVGNATDEFEMADTVHISPDGESATGGLLTNGEGYTYTNGQGRDTADTTGSIGPLTSQYYTELEYSIRATDEAVTGRTYCFRVYDTTADAPIDQYKKYPSARIKSTTLTASTTMEWGTQSGVGDDSWTTINFSGTYTSPVFLCTVQYDNNIGNESVNNAAAGVDADSIVCRVQNVGATSAQVRLQEAGVSDVLDETVHWMVVEEGTYDTGDIKMEAFTYTSTVTDENGSWTGQEQTYGQSYTNPVVLGQVMTYNDAGWSVFWSRGASAQSDPADSTLITGKHVGEDTDTTRSDETIGVVVIEQDHNSLGTVDFEAWQNTGNNIDRIDESPNDTYTFDTSFSSTPSVGLVSQAGINGADGPHPVLYGSTPLSTTTINPTIMEDEINDDDQGGNPEDVAYLVFSAAGTYAATEVALDQTTYRFYVNADAVQPTTPLANENTDIASVADSDVVRVRMGIQVGVNDLSSGSLAFTMQYGEGAVCSAIGTWYDVGGVGSGTIWRGYNNVTPADGATLTASLLNAQANDLASYEEANDSVNNPNTVSRGNWGEWDWVLENNGATAGTDYCFRMITTDDQVITYTNYPQITTASGSETPTMVQLLRHGAWFNASGVEQPFTF